MEQFKTVYKIIKFKEIITIKMINNITFYQLSHLDFSKYFINIDYSYLKGCDKFLILLPK